MTNKIPKYSNKKNINIYIDLDLVKKAREKGYNLSQFFEMKLKEELEEIGETNKVEKIDISDPRVMAKIYEKFKLEGKL